MKQNSKFEQSAIADLDASVVAIELALEVLQQPLAVYDCSDAELDRSIEQLKMMRVSYLLLQRNATKPKVYTYTGCTDPACFPCDCMEPSA